MADDNVGGGGAPAATPPGPNDPPSIIADGGATGNANGGAPATPAAPPGNFVTGDGTFQPDWTSRLPEELSDARAGFGKYRNVVELAKGLHNANRMIGQRGVIVPTQDSPPEDVAAFRKALGVPDSVDGYKEIKPEQLPPGVDWNDEIAKPYIEIAHKHNITPKALKEMVSLHAKQRELEMQATIADVDRRREEGRMLLQQTWRDKYGDNVKTAKQAAILAQVDPSSFGFGDPQVVLGFVRLASMLSEDRLKGQGAAPAGAADLAAKARDVQQNKDNPLYKRYQEGDPDTVAMVRGWIKTATGE
jgi:hypothetical protein